LGQFLLNTLSLAPKVDAEEIEKDLYVFLVRIHRSRALTTYFHSNNHIQDILLVSYLANTIRTQIDLSNRLVTATLSTGGEAAAGSEQKGGQRGDRQQNQRSGAGQGGRRGEQ
jgi:translation initiation factor 3 subunit F